MRTFEFALYLLLVLTLVGVLQAQEQPPDERHDEHSRCMPPDVAKGYGPAEFTILPCECHQVCIRPDPDAGQTFEPYTAEDTNCRKYCAKRLCTCHLDENPCAYEEPTAP